MQKVGRLLTRQEVEKRLRISTTALYRSMRKGLLPVPIRIGGKAVRWSEEEIEAYLTDPKNRATGDAGVGTRDSS